MSYEATVPTIGNALAEEIDDELANAIAKHGPMHSPHEAYAVLMEELDEFWECVRAWHSTDATTTRNPRKELIQVAAMSIRAIKDLGLVDVFRGAISPEAPKP